MTDGSGSPDPAAEKAALRRRLQGELAALDADVRHRAAAEVTARVLAHPLVAAAGHLLVCLSFSAELDTRGLIDALGGQGRRLYVPRADPRDRTLHVHPYPCALETLSFGLRQPPRGERQLAPEAVARTLDAALVLGLAFDRRGYRLGYGSGYFDRFFAAHPVPAVGLAYDLQLVDRLPVEPHDRPMQVVVTETATVERPGR